MLPLTKLASAILILSSVCQASTDGAGPLANQVNAAPLGPTLSPNPLNQQPPPSQSPQQQQAVASTCYALNTVTDNDGKTVQWKAKCRVEIWDKDHQNPGDKAILDKVVPEILQKQDGSSTSSSEALSQLALQQQQKVISGSTTGDIPQQLTALQQETLDKAKELDHVRFQAAVKHQECVEAKSAMFKLVKDNIPIDLKNKDDVLATIHGNTKGTKIHLAPNVGLYIGHLDDEMKEKLAKIHEMENSSNAAAEPDKALQDERLSLAEYIDKLCREEDPSAKFHGISQFPSDALKQAKMTLILFKPGKKVEFLNLPETAYEHHYEYLQAMAEAAATEAQRSGKPGEYDVFHHPMIDSVKEKEFRALTGMDHPSIFHGFQLPSVVVVHHPKTDETTEKLENSSDLPKEKVDSTVIDSSTIQQQQQPPGSESIADNPLPLQQQQQPPGSENIVVNPLQQEQQQQPPGSENIVVNPLQQQQSSPNPGITELSANLTTAEAMDVDKKDEALKAAAAEYLATDSRTKGKPDLIDMSTMKFWGKAYSMLSKDQKKIESEYKQNKADLAFARDQLKKTEMKDTAIRMYDLGKKDLAETRRTKAAALKSQVPASPGLNSKEEALQEFATSLKTIDPNDAASRGTAIKTYLDTPGRYEGTSSMSSAFSNMFNRSSPAEREIEKRNQERKAALTTAIDKMKKQTLINAELGLKVLTEGTEMLDDERLAEMTAAKPAAIVALPGDSQSSTSTSQQQGSGGLFSSGSWFGRK